MPDQPTTYSTHKLRQQAASGLGEAGAMVAEVTRMSRAEDEDWAPTSPHVMDLADVTRGLGLDSADEQRVQKLIREQTVSFQPKGQGGQRLMHGRGSVLETMRRSMRHVPADTRGEILRRADVYWRKNYRVDTGREPTVRLGLRMSKSEGAGSRGGHVIGHTRSGKPVYAHSHGAYASPGGFHAAHKGWSAGDHLAAEMLHRGRGNKDAANQHRAAVKQTIGTQMEAQMSKADVVLGIPVEALLKAGGERAGHKYLSRKPDGKGGWVYAYGEKHEHGEGHEKVEQPKKKAPFEIAGRSGKESREGHHYGDFAVHQEKRYHHVVTHKPSGMMVTTVPGKEEAHALAHHLGQHANGHSGNDADSAKQILRAAHAFKHEMKDGTEWRHVANADHPASGGRHEQLRRIAEHHGDDAELHKKADTEQAYHHAGNAERAQREGGARRSMWVPSAHRTAAEEHGKAAAMFRKIGDEKNAAHHAKQHADLTDDIERSDAYDEATKLVKRGRLSADDHDKIADHYERHGGRSSEVEAHRREAKQRRAEDAAYDARQAARKAAEGKQDKRHEVVSSKTGLRLRDASPEEARKYEGQPGHEAFRKPVHLNDDEMVDEQTGHSGDTTPMRFRKDKAEKALGLPAELLTKGEARGGKYYRRVPTGNPKKPWRYYYTKAQYDAAHGDGAHHDGPGVREARQGDSAAEGPDHSAHPTVVEYAVQSIFKGKSPTAAARHTASRLAGGTNLFIGGGHEKVSIDPKKLEAAIWDRVVEHAVASAKRVKPGMEHMGVGGSADHFRLGKADQAKLKSAVETKLGHTIQDF